MCFKVDERRSIKLSVMVERFYICAVRHIATSHMLLSTWNVASLIGEMDFKFYLIWTHVHFNSHMWPVAIALDAVQKQTLENDSMQ